MIILATDYPNDVAVTAAIDTYLVNLAEVYLTMATYDLSRDCSQEDFFINTLHHQLMNGWQDNELFSGFDTYIHPDAYYGISYINGYNTTYVLQPTQYAPGVTELTITVVSSNSAVVLNNTDITLHFGTVSYTVTANASGVATFTFTPAAGQTSVQVTSQLAEAASNAIALGYHGEELDTDTYSFAAGASTYGFATTSDAALPSARAVGDVDQNGILSQGDLLKALNMGATSRLRFTSHATVSLGTLLYNTGVAGSIAYTLTPNNVDYANGTGTGQFKVASDLKYSIITIDSDGSPEVGLLNPSQKDIIPSGLNADGSYSGTIALGNSFNNPLIVVFALSNAYNTAVLQTTEITGLTAAITANSSFEPSNAIENNDIEITVSDDSGSLADVAGSLVYCYGYPTSAFLGSALVSGSAIVGAGNTATATITVPSTVDQDIFFKAGYVSYTVNNLISIEYLADSSLDVDTYLTVASDVTYYTSGDETITLTVTMVGSYVRSHYALTISLVETNNSIPETILTADTSATTVTFDPTEGALNGLKSIVAKISLATA